MGEVKSSVATMLDAQTGLNAIRSAASREEITDVVRRCGFSEIADRLDYLIELEAEEPDEEPMQIDSLRSVAEFVLGERDVYDPDIGVGADGVIGLSWRLSPNGMVYLRFREAGAARVALIAPTPNDGDDPAHISGAVSLSDVMTTIAPYVPQTLAR